MQRVQVLYLPWPTALCPLALCWFLETLLATRAGAGAVQAGKNTICPRLCPRPSQPQETSFLSPADPSRDSSMNSLM